jgi:hypothetical protein
MKQEKNISVATETQRNHRHYENRCHHAHLS